MRLTAKWFRAKWFTTATLAAALGAAGTLTAATAVAQDGTAPRAREGRGGALRQEFGRSGAQGARRFRMKHRMQRVAAVRQRLAETMQWTPDQQRLALEKARAAQPIVAEARKELARILAQGAPGANTDGTGEAGKAAKQTGRKAQRDAVRTLRHATAEKLAPLAKDVVAGLTAEQRAKLEGFAAARGRKLDDGKLTKRISKWLARPMTADLLEARLGTR